MEAGSLIIFYILGVIIIASSVMAVTTRKMMRAATYLFFVLLGMSGLYLMLNYHFLFAVQLSVYAGGILILFLFAILLINRKGDTEGPHDTSRAVVGILTSVVGIIVVSFITLKHEFLYADNLSVTGDHELSMKTIGHALVGTGKYEYLLVFEVLGILLLACAIAGIVIARKR